LRAVGLPQSGPASNEDCDSGLGCFHEVLSDLRLRCVSLPTEPDASAPGALRACACKF
jgi:hypothetical protein